MVNHLPLRRLPKHGNAQLTDILILGAHINPAVTLAFASVQRFPLWKVPIYIISQMLGGIISAAFVYAIYFGMCGKYM